jgi:hypothetical protein
MGHPDFRVRGKIFATLHYPDQNWGMVKLPPEHQHNFVHDQPEAFVPVKGAWGRQGSTNVRLDTVDLSTLRRAMELARNSAVPVSQRKQTRKKRKGH